MSRSRAWARHLAATAAVLATAFLALAGPTPAPWRLALGLGALMAILAAVAGRAVNAHLRRYPRVAAAAMGLWGLVVAWLLIGANGQAGWGLIDDHEILYTLGPTGRLTLGELGSLLATHKEVGRPTADWPRYRPGYYVLRFGECYLWGGDPARWYLARTLLLAATLALCCRLLWRWLGAVGGSLLLLLALTYPFWWDVWTRLGPAEAYAMVGVALVLNGAYDVWRLSRARRAGGVSPPMRAHPSKPSAMNQDVQTGGRASGGSRPPLAGARSAVAWGMLTVGALVAMGCKENFLVLLPAIWFWLAVLWWRRPLPWGGRVAAVAITAGGVFIAATVGSALRQVQADVYKHSVSPGGRLQLLIPALQAFVTRPEGLALAGGLLLLASIGPAGPSARFRRRLLVGAAAVVALVGLYVSQYVFYLGDFPRTQRYDFPGLMVYPVLAGVEAWLLAGWLRARGWLRVRRVLMVVTLAGLTAGVAVRGFPFQGAVAANVAHTQPLARHLAAVIARLQAEPGRPLLLDSHSAGDYEPILAVRRILAVRGVTNPCFLRLNGYTPESYGLTDYRDQAEQLQNLSLRGRHGDLGPPWTFVPLEQLPAEPRPFGLGFAAPPGPDTESLGRLW